MLASKHNYINCTSYYWTKHDKPRPGKPGMDTYFYLFMVYLTNVISSDYAVSNDSINLKGFEGRWSWPNLKCYAHICQLGWWEAIKSSIRKAVSGPTFKPGSFPT